MASVEDFIRKHLGIDPGRLLDWRVTSSALSNGLIRNTLILSIGEGAHPIDRVGSLMPVVGTCGHIEILLLKGEETSELFAILAKTMFVEGAGMSPLEGIIYADN